MKITTLFTFMLFSFACFSTSLIDQKLADSLASDPVWLKLLHYNNGKGEITTDGFYFSKHGRHDPKAELMATLKALIQPKSENSNLHAQCKFRARYYWLSKFDFWLSIHAPKILCENYYNWSDEANISSASMIFATGYLSNPASFFGHMLLKFNNSKEVTDTNLLDVSINYGAVVPPNENAIIYILKGLLGGYDAKYTQGSYYRFNHNYTNIDQRDIWEYRLNLTQQETQLLLAHSWELLNNNFKYFYLTKNCAYRIAKLLELILDKPIKSRQSYYVVPVEIFREISTYEHKGNPLLSATNRVLSKQNKFYEKYYSLEEKEKLILQSLISSENIYNNLNYKIVSDEIKIKIVDTLIDYYDVKIKKSGNQQDKERKRIFLLEMLNLSNKTPVFQWVHKEKKAPHLAQKPSVISMGAIYNTDFNKGVHLQYRAAYFDMLTPDVGKMPFAKIYMANFELDFFKGEQIDIKKIDIVDIESLGLPKTGLPGDKPIAWKFSFGWDRPDTDCRECLTGKIEGSIGSSHKINNSIALYGYMEGRYQNLKRGYEHMSFGAQLGMIANISDQWRFQLVGNYRDYIDTDNDPKNLIKFENRFGLSTEWDIRLIYEKQENSTYALKLGYYFN